MTRNRRLDRFCFCSIETSLIQYIFTIRLALVLVWELRNSRAFHGFRKLLKYHGVWVGSGRVGSVRRTRPDPTRYDPTRPARVLTPPVKSAACQVREGTGRAKLQSPDILRSCVVCACASACVCACVFYCVPGMGLCVPVFLSVGRFVLQCLACVLCFVFRVRARVCRVRVVWFIFFHVSAVFLFCVLFFFVFFGGGGVGMLCEMNTMWLLRWRREGAEGAAELYLCIYFVYVVYDAVLCTNPSYTRKGHDSVSSAALLRTLFPTTATNNNSNNNSNKTRTTAAANNDN